MERNQPESLPMNAMSSIPTPREDARHIVALVRQGGRTTGYRLSDGQTVSKQQGVALAKQGGIRGVGISRRQGREYLKSLPDGSEENNLTSLPSVTEQALEEL